MLFCFYRLVSLGTDYNFGFGVYTLLGNLLVSMVWLPESRVGGVLFWLWGVVGRLVDRRLC